MTRLNDMKAAQNPSSELTGFHYVTLPFIPWELLSISINSFNLHFKQNGTRKYKFLVIGKQDTYFVRHQSDSLHKYSGTDIKGILDFLVDNIYVVFGDQVFEQSVRIPMGTNCAPLLADFSCEIVALRENFVDRPESYDSFSAKSCVFLAHSLRYISPFPYTT
jgi:hypothetical protein